MAKIGKKNGFTLIELVVVAGLLGMLSIGIVSMLLSSIRSREKAQIQAELRAKGDYVITQLERSLRFASDLPTTTAAGSTPCAGKEIWFKVDGVQKKFVFDSSFVENEVGKLVDFSAENSNGSFNSSQYFTCYSDSGKKSGYVEVNFTLTINGVSQDFKTRIAMRNLK